MKKKYIVLGYGLIFYQSIGAAVFQQESFKVAYDTIAAEVGSFRSHLPEDKRRKIGKVFDEMDKMLGECQIASDKLKKLEGECAQLRAQLAESEKSSKSQKNQKQKVEILQKAIDDLKQKAMKIEEENKRLKQENGQLKKTIEEVRKDAELQGLLTTLPHSSDAHTAEQVAQPPRRK